MSHRLTVVLIAGLALAGCGDSATPASDPAPDPFALPAAPPADVYDGPLFELSHDYPTGRVSPPNPPPWQAAIDFQPINTANANVYVLALKQYIAADMKRLLFDYPAWDAAAAGWYNQPWLTSVREPIHGTYVGSTFPANMFPISGLSAEMSTHVLVYYDAVAAQSLDTVWGETAMDPLPGLGIGGAQFPEGGIIVKPAFTTAGPSEWAPIEGAFPWQIYAAPDDGSEGALELQTTYLFQFDIIVKDSASSPETGWVFSTLIYDLSVPGDDWDKMVPLGAMWGNDPDVLSPEQCDYLEENDCPPLFQTWINQDTPVYARETLGWGGRLSGPNDGAVDVSAVLQLDDGLVPYPGRLAMSSCMSCHGTAQFEMQSFLVPSPATCTEDECAPTTATCTDGVCTESASGTSLVYYDPGSDEFLRWFQSRSGDDPQNPGAIPLDYGMNLSFKALPLWFSETGQGDLNFTR